VVQFINHAMMQEDLLYVRWHSRETVNYLLPSNCFYLDFSNV